MVWELIYLTLDRQTVGMSKRSKVALTESDKRMHRLNAPFFFLFFFVLINTAPDVLHSQCIHTCQTNGLIIRLPLLMFVLIACLLHKGQ